LYLPPDIWIFLWSDPEEEEQVIVGGINNITIPSPLGYPPVFFRNSSDFVNLFRNIRNTFYDGFNNK
jgi:alpha-glucosidase